MDEQDLYRHLVKELARDGTLSMEVSGLICELRASPSISSTISSMSSL
jgi:hypothetical protein